MSNVPNGYKQNSLGHLVPESAITAIDQLRDETVLDILDRAKQLQKHIEEEKAWIQKLIQDFIEVSFQEHGVEIGGKKRGGITLTSFDGNVKVQVAIADQWQFNEKIQAAKAMIDECLTAWSEGGNENIKAIVLQSFQVSKEGKINTREVYNLTKLAIDDPLWKKAMDELKESFRVQATKEYIRILERTSPDEKHKQVVLDFSSL